MNNLNLYHEDIPSKNIELLQSFINIKIKEIIRYSWDEPEDVIKSWNIKQEKVFSLTSGPLIVVFDNGLVVGFSSLPSKASVTLWLEVNENGDYIKEELTSNDSELYPIAINDKKFSIKKLQELPGKKIIDIKILKRSPANALLACKPGEAGLQLTFENGTELVLSHGLFEDGDDFTVLLKSEISMNILQELVEQKIEPAN